MPELPEVETIARSLRDDTTPAGGGVIGKTILGARVLWNKTIATPSPEAFTRRIKGQTITAIGRRAKYLILHLSQDKLIIHLRMSGDIVLRPPAEEPAKHDRVLLNLDDALQLAFNDTRKFGRVWLLENPAQLFSKLGPEPLEDSFTPEVFYTSLQKRKRQIKPLLLDQAFLAGMGNIYTDEALHRSKIHPLQSANTLSDDAAATLWENIRQVLHEGIRNNGASIDWVYRGGDFQNHFQAYGRTREPCYTCGSPIERIVVGQRSTHFCPSCQPLQD